MSVRLVVKNSLPASVSPYRLLDDHGREIAWANAVSRCPEEFANSHCAPCAPTPMTYSTWHAGSKVRGTLWLGLINPFCSTMSVTNSSTSPHPRRRPSITACACCAAYIASITDRKFPASRIFQRRYTTRSSLGYGRRQHQDYD